MKITDDIDELKRRFQQFKNENDDHILTFEYLRLHNAYVQAYEVGDNKKLDDISKQLILCTIALELDSIRKYGGSAFEL